MGLRYLAKEVMVATRVGKGLQMNSSLGSN